MDNLSQKNFYLRHKKGDCTKKNVKSKYRLSSLIRATTEVTGNTTAVVECHHQHHAGGDLDEYDDNMGGNVDNNTQVNKSNDDPGT